jgi:hypothetical protein
MGLWQISFSERKPGNTSSPCDLLNPFTPSITRRFYFSSLEIGVFAIA